MNIRITLKSGEVIEHLHKGRPGGSYTKYIRYDGGFAIVTDEYERETAYPERNIEKVETWSTREGW